MSNQEHESAAGGIPAIAGLQGIAIEPQANRPGIEEGFKCPQADADIFNALFSKWGRDEEASMVGSFDDLLWDEGAAAVAAAAASMGWQRTSTPSVPSQQLNKLLCSEPPPQQQQQQQRAWAQASAQQLQQEQQSKPGPMIGQQLLCGSTIINPVLPKVRLPAHANNCADKAQCTALPQTPSASNTDAEAAKSGMEQLHPGCMLPTPLSAPMAAATAATQSVAEQLASSVPMPLPDAGSLQQLSAAFAAGQISAGGSRILPQLSLQSMLHLQQQVMTDLAVGSSMHQPQQLVAPPINSLYSYQLSAQQVVQPGAVAAAAAGASSWSPGNITSAGGLDTAVAATAAAGSFNGMPGLAGLQQGGLGGGLDATATVLAMQAALQQQQQLLRLPGLPLGLHLPGAGPGFGPGLGWLGSNLATSAQFGFPPAGGMFNPAAAFAGGLGAQQQVAAGQQMLMQQAIQQLQQQHQLLQEAQAPQLQVAAGLADGPATAAGIAAGANGIRPSFMAMLGDTAYLPTAPPAAPAPAAATATAGNSAGGAAGTLGLMGPPPPHAPAGAAAATAAAAEAGGVATNSNSKLAQLPGHLAELLAVQGLGVGQLGSAVGAAGLQLPALPNLPPLFPGSWPLHLAGLLRPPAVQTTNILQLAMMMQSAMQASPVPCAGDTQQAAMVVAALQGLAANMRMLMPWTNDPAPWQPHAAVPPQQELLNGSCLASGGVLPRQLSSSYGGAGGQKAMLQFGSQPQTSTTDISGQAGLPGCHSHPTAVAAACVPMAGLTGAAIGVMALAGVQRPDSLDRREAAAKPKQKRKQRHPDNRARYEGRKIRANNRVRVKGRFVKMGPNGPILPGSEANEQHHSEHEASDAELTDPDNHDHHHSSSWKPHTTVAAETAAAALTLAGAGGVSKVRRISKVGTEEAVVAPGCDAAAPGSPPAAVRICGKGVQPLCSAAAEPGWTEDGAVVEPWHVQEVRTKPCCTGDGDCCLACRDSGPAASDRPCVGHVGQTSEGQQLCRHAKRSRGAQCKGAAAGCSGGDRALGHAGDGPCCCDDPHGSSGGPGWAAGIASDGCGATSVGGLGTPADDSCGGHANRLVRHHSNNAAATTLSTCRERQPAVDHTMAAEDGMPAVARQSSMCNLELSAARGTAAGSAACAEPAAKRLKWEQACEQQRQRSLPRTDAAEAAAMPVPESEMLHATSLHEHLPQQPTAAALDPREAAAPLKPREQPAALPPPAAGGVAGAATFAAAAADVEDVAADMDMAGASDAAEVVPEAGETADAMEQQLQDHQQQEQGQVDLVCCGKQTEQLATAAAAITAAPTAMPAPGVPPGKVQLSAAAVMQRSAGTGQTTTTHLVQAAVTNPADNVAAAAAALQCWTATQQQERSPTPAQPLPTSSWGSSLGFRAWGAGRPVGAGGALARPCLPLGMPLPVNLLAAAPFGGVGGAGQVLPDVPALPAVTAGSMPPPASFNLTATLAALQQQGTSPGALSPAVSAAAGAGSFSPWALPGALLGTPAPLAAAAAAAGLPVGGGRPGSCSPAPGVQLLGGQFVHGHVSQLMPLHGGCWPLAAAAVGRFAAGPQRQPRQRRRGQAAAESEQTDSCQK